MTKRITLGSLTLIAVALISSLITWYIAGHEPTPQLLVADEASTSIPVVNEAFDDRHNVRLHPVNRESIDLLAPSSGKITQLACGPGQKFSSLEGVVTIDAEEKVAFYSSVPLWRDLSIDTTGKDVSAFQESLKMKDDSLSVTGRMNRETLDVWKKLTKSILGTQDSVIRLDNIVWIPDESITVDTCATQLGATIEAGQPLIKTVPTMTGIKIELPEDFTPGKPGEKYVLSFADATAEVTDGFVDDPQLMKAIQQSEDYSQWAKEPDKTLLSGSYHLATPREAYRVLSRAIATNKDCAYIFPSAEGHPIKIQPLSAKLGSTVFTPDIEKDASPKKKQIPSIPSHVTMPTPEMTRKLPSCESNS
ncbi:MAG: hypothetical protein Q4P66_07530 [Actinomycetaceae bacterium]|nr:hypothetical protein [Actinomycetaceae bacterium]